MAEYYSPQPPKTKKHAGGTLRVVLFGVVILVLLAVGLANRQYIFDQFTVWAYKPTSDIAAITTNAGLTDKGKFYFYASRPEVDSAEAFNLHCERREEHSAILGCYDGRQIFIYNVTDAQLAGIKEVTAAHEMLHAAWERLGDAEQKRLATLLEAEFRNHTTVELEERMAYYERTQPGERINELHSIIGTEIADINSELEAYYKSYFADRNTLVAKHDAYNKVFKDLEDQASALYAQIEALQKDIASRKESYEAATTALEQENAALEQQYASMDRSDQSEVSAYNARASAYNQQLEAIRAQYAEITQLIASHNEKVVQYNQITGSRQKLQDSIDSLKAPQA